MASNKVDDAQIEAFLADHRPITVAGLTFTAIGQADGDIRIDLPKNRGQEATIMDVKGAEALCCWLTLRFPAVREYIERLQKKHGEISDGKTLGQAIQESVKKIRGDASRPGPHSGDATWLAEKTGLTPMTVFRYLTDQAIPQNNIALRIARILGWSDTEMQKRISDQHVRREVEKGKARVKET